MAPPSGQKGTAAGKKGSSAINRQRSRNTTPMGGAAPPQQSAGSTLGGTNGTGSGGATSSSSLGVVNSASTSFSGIGGGGGAAGGSSMPAVESIETEFLDLKFESMRSLSYDDLLDAVANSAAGIPDSRSLDGLITRLGKLNEIIERRGQWCDKGMRLVAVERKNHYNEIAAGGGRRGGDDSKDENDAGEKKSNKKKRKASDNLAPPDSNAPERSSPLRDPGNKRKHSRAGSASSSLSPAAAGSPTAMDVDEKPKSEKKDDEEEEEESSEDEGAPPRREAPQYQTFGEDPSTFPDPTVYEILETNPSMSVDELKEIYSVAVFPKTNLADQIAGDPPDKDFTIAKPQNQISFSTFSTYIEPYFRPFSEEDLAFLRERGDRVTPFNMPKRGKKHYTEIWREEDGGMSIDSNQGRDKLQPNQPRGSIDNMDDDVAETDKLSVGPILARLLQAMRPEGRAADDKPATNGVNGDADKDDQPSGETNGVNGEDGKSLPPASYMNESSSEAWKKATHPKLDYSQVDERIKQELRHIGFLPQEGFEGDYDGHFDDEVAGRLRLLQDRLRQQMLINGARKARLTELVKERMAFQEYTTILEDLDSQVQGAYLKRTRTMGKSKKAKRPGGAGGGAAAANAAAGMARPGIGDVTKMLMERRKRWIDNIGTVFDDENLGKVPRSENPDSSIFKPDMMGDLIKKEKQAWDEEVEEE